MAERITNETARELRAIWFRYLDTLEPELRRRSTLRSGPLH